MWWQNSRWPSKMALMIPTYLYSQSFVVPFTWVLAGRGKGISLVKIRYKILWLPSCSYCISGSSCSLPLREASCLCVHCSIERPTWQGTEASLQPTAKEKLRPQSNSLWESELYQQDLFPVKIPGWSLAKDPEPGDPVKPHSDAWTKETVRW